MPSISTVDINYANFSVWLERFRNFRFFQLIVDRFQVRDGIVYFMSSADLLTVDDRLCCPKFDTVE